MQDLGFGFHYSSLPLIDTGKDEASHIAGFPDCQGNSKAIELLAPLEQTLSYSRGAAAPSPKLLLSPLTRTATVRLGYYILLFLLWIYWSSDLTITEHRLSQMWQYSWQNLGYSLGNSLRAATMTWEGPTQHLEFWFGDAAFLVESHLPTKLTLTLHEVATEINGKALSDSQESLPGLRLPPEMPAHPLPWAFLTTGIFSGW